MDTLTPEQLDNFQAVLMAAKANRKATAGEYESNFGKVWRDGKVVAFVNGKVYVPASNASIGERKQLRALTIGEFEQEPAPDRFKDAEDKMEPGPEAVPPEEQEEEEEEVDEPGERRMKPKRPITAKEPDEIDTEPKTQVLEFPTLRFRK